VYAATGSQVRDVFVDGMPLVRGGETVSGRDSELLDDLKTLQIRVRSD
jgi:hypothetical protein